MVRPLSRNNTGPAVAPENGSDGAGFRSIATLQGIVATLMPDFPELCAEDRRAIAGDVTHYVAAQIEAMPAFLRIPYRVALLAFELLPVVRYGRPFGRLHPKARDAYLAWWSDAPGAAMRDSVKLIRSTSLLVFFDHPLVRTQLDRQRRADSRRDADNVDG
jgi:hypothetical protein